MAGVCFLLFQCRQGLWLILRGQRREEHGRALHALGRQPRTLIAGGMGSAVHGRSKLALSLYCSSNCDHSELQLPASDIRN